MNKSKRNPRNSKWHKSQPRPRPWWLGEKKEEKAYRKETHAATKNGAYDTIFDVKVGDASVGLTFDYREAQAWLKAASSFLKPYVERKVYSLPQEARRG